MDHILSTGADLFLVPFKGNEFDVGRHNFHTFPDEKGWLLNSKYQFELTPDRTPSIPDFEKFMQSWLFFGLLDAVIYLGSPKTREKIDVEKFHFQAHGDHWIRTVELGTYLDRWETSEADNKDGQTMRMIRAQFALDKARLVIRNYCSLDEMKNTPGVQSTFRLGDKLALSLMVLGETLQNAKAKIVARVGFNIRGWHGDATQGWGTPRIIFDKMRTSRWCMRTVGILRRQLRSHATALLAAYMSHPESHMMSRGHETCTEDECKKENPGGYYQTGHMEECPNPGGCRMVGPDIDEVVNAIDENKIPLFRFSGTQDRLNIDVVPADPHKFAEYATISHVWTDGYGNTEKNELRECQLRFFRDLFRKAQNDPIGGGGNIDFWIDTLAIPVEERHKDRRKKAIGQIYEVYTRAKYTIVIDNGLREMAPEQAYEKTAMKILASGWMRRLWTLQEAYLSGHVFFAFEDSLVNLDILEKEFGHADQKLVSNVPQAARNYFHNLLGQERKERIHSLSPPQSLGLVASVWRAAHWRTTAHAEHEVLALATMLRLVNRSTPFAEAGVLPKKQASRDTKTKEKQQELINDENLENMMKELWILLEEVHPGCIPPGVIFLPGKKLSIDNFQWAPKTWMVGQELDEPDPLGSMRQPASFEADLGLCVRYPGFLLHTINPKHLILSKKRFSFPIDNTLQEKYTASRAEIAEEEPLYGAFHEKPVFAIILSRDRPGQNPEIALLVEIIRRSPPREFDAQHTAISYHVRIVTRVRVCREMHHDRNFITTPHGQEEEILCGEVLDNNQKWYVGGSRYLKRGDASETFAAPKASQDRSQSRLEFGRPPRVFPWGRKRLSSK